jgi:hypothetical protein
MKQYFLAVAAIVFLGVSFTPRVGAADNPNQILTAFRAAHESKKIDEVARLVRFQTQDSARRASWLKDVTAAFPSKISSIKIVPFAEYAFVLPESERKRLAATMKPANWLLVEFAPQQSDSGRSESTSYLIGLENGAYFIVGP